jgi:hypothetical protein
MDFDLAAVLVGAARTHSPRDIYQGAVIDSKFLWVATVSTKKENANFPGVNIQSGGFVTV